MGESVHRWVYRGERKGQCDREMEKKKPSGHSKPSAKCSVKGVATRKKRKKREREGGGGVVHGRVAGKGREWRFECEVMGLDLGLTRQVRKGARLTQDQ